MLKQRWFKSAVLKKEHIQKGTYLPADILVNREVGALRASALKAATAYITKRISNARGLVQVQPWEFLFLRHGYKDAFEEAWALHITEESAPRPPPVQGAVEEGDGEVPHGDKKKEAKDKSNKKGTEAPHKRHAVEKPSKARTPWTKPWGRRGK